MDRILNPHQIIKGIKPKQKATFNQGSFDRNKPIWEHNFPLTKYTIWDIYGYRKDKLTGLKRPYWIKKTVPTGASLTPKKVGLDGFFTVRPINQIK